MPHRLRAEWWCFAIALLLCLLPFSMLAKNLGHAESNTFDWANPRAITLQKLNETPGASVDPAFYENTDCTSLTYRRVGESTMRSGCFMQTAFGLMEAGSQEVIFNGTDEAVPIVGPGSGLLVPMPGSAVTADLSGYPVVGSYMHFYKYLPKVLSDVRDATGTLRAKQITSGTDLDLTDPGGQLIAVNTQTIAFSSNNSWMVVESPFHSFIRINLATFEMKPFAPSFNGWAYDYAQHDARIAISDDGRYIAIATNEFHGFKVYDLDTCTGEVTADLRALNCTSHDYWLKINDAASNLSRLLHVRFTNDSTLSFEAIYPGTGSAEKTVQYELSPSDHIGNLIEYLALGDSYTSGEGAFDYLEGTDTSTNHCHISSHSYPVLLTHDLFTATSGHSVACSGAVIYDLFNQSSSYPGQVGSKALQDGVGGKDKVLADYLPGYAAQYEFAKKYQPRILTVSVAGNNVGFGEILQTCVTPKLLHHTCYNTYEDQEEVINAIDRTEPELQNLYKQLRSVTPSSTIYAIGYPQIVDPDGNCALNVHLDSNELLFAQAMVTSLDSMIQDAADNSGVTYIDISQALAGHKLCETKDANVAVNGLTAGTDGGVHGVDFLGKESYHPNALGQQLIEQAILDQTHNFTLVKTPIPSIGSAKLPLLGAIKTGRKIRTVIHDSTVTKRTVIRGRKITVQANGVKNGLVANKGYAVTLGREGPTIGSLASDGQGNISGEVTIPSDASSGYNTIDVNGDDQTGNPIDVTEPIYVGDADNDYDGDGLPNNTDTCPNIADSGQDIDGDGIDDTCDDNVTTPLNTGGGASSTTTPSSNQDKGGSTGQTPTDGTPPQLGTGSEPPATAQANPSLTQASNVSGVVYQSTFLSPLQATKLTSTISSKSGLLGVTASGYPKQEVIKQPLLTPGSFTNRAWTNLPKLPIWILLLLCFICCVAISAGKQIITTWKFTSSIY